MDPRKVSDEAIQSVEERLMQNIDYILDKKKQILQQRRYEEANFQRQREGSFLGKMLSFIPTFGAEKNGKEQ